MRWWQATETHRYDLDSSGIVFDCLLIGIISCWASAGGEGREAEQVALEMELGVKGMAAEEVAVEVDGETTNESTVDFGRPADG
eukprot:6604374-Prymnesium_polylepis.2